MLRQTSSFGFGYRHGGRRASGGVGFQPGPLAVDLVDPGARRQGAAAVGGDGLSGRGREQVRETGADGRLLKELFDDLSALLTGMKIDPVEFAAGSAGERRGLSAIAASGEPAAGCGLRSQSTQGPEPFAGPRRRRGSGFFAGA